MVDDCEGGAGQAKERSREMRPKMVDQPTERSGFDVAPKREQQSHVSNGGNYDVSMDKGKWLYCYRCCTMPLSASVMGKFGVSMGGLKTNAQLSRELREKTTIKEMKGAFKLQPVLPLLLHRSSRLSGGGLRAVAPKRPRWPSR